MLTYILRRLGLAAITVVAITIVTFGILHLPPVDFVTAYAAQAAASGSSISAAEADAMRLAYGLNEPLWVQYWKWLAMVATGNFGRSFEYGRPVTEVIGDRLWLTVLLSLGAIFVTWGLALPIGIYSAVRQYSFGDYIFTFLGFIGLAQFHAGADRDVFRPALVRRQRRRPVLRQPATGTVELDESRGSDEPLAGARADPGPCRNRPTGPHHARQPPG
jgi:ABC-type microcin C transport system permease subunit YejB